MKSKVWASQARGNFIHTRFRPQNRLPVMWSISPHGISDTRHIQGRNTPSGCHQHWDFVNVPEVQVDNELITSRGTFALAQHRLSRSSVEGSTKRQTLARTQERPAEVTDIIPFNEFGDLADLD